VSRVKKSRVAGMEGAQAPAKVLSTYFKSPHMVGVIPDIVENGKTAVKLE
jgi:hypothetical protein